MLVLSRQRNESIIINGNIIVTVVDVRGDKVRLGIDAPTEIPVHRQEVYEAIQRENLRASQLEPKDAQGLGVKSQIPLVQSVLISEIPAIPLAPPDPAPKTDDTLPDPGIGEWV